MLEGLSQGFDWLEKVPFEVALVREMAALMILVKKVYLLVLDWMVV